ncbi:MAG: hypothetical protein H8D05_01465 [FCB group bacterium]|nr:hypothetical protein [FCB group bacterium]
MEYIMDGYPDSAAIHASSVLLKIAVEERYHSAVSRAWIPVSMRCVV